MYKLLVDDFYYESDSFIEILNLIDDDYMIKDYDFEYMYYNEDFNYLIEYLKNEGYNVL